MRTAPLVVYDSCRDPCLVLFAFGGGVIRLDLLQSSSVHSFVRVNDKKSTLSMDYSNVSVGVQYNPCIGIHKFRTFHPSIMLQS